MLELSVFKPDFCREIYILFLAKRAPLFSDPSSCSLQSGEKPWLPLSSLPPFPSVFRFPTPTGCSHANVTADVPIELLTARPPVASARARERSMHCCFYTSLSFH